LAVEASKRETSAFFFLGRLAPDELANFNIQNHFLPDHGAVLEVFGHAIAIWWPKAERAASEDLLDRASQWMRTIASAYYLESDGIALDVRLLNWVEALHVEAREAIIGSTDDRFRRISVVEESAPVNDSMLRAIRLAERLRGSLEYERAVQEAWTAGNEFGYEWPLSAFRALECIRRTYEPKWSDRERGWKRMKTSLTSYDADAHDLLSDAAEAIRHGDAPTGRRTSHPVNRARARREELLLVTREMITESIRKGLPEEASDPPGSLDSVEPEIEEDTGAMGERRIDEVHVPLSRESVTLPWASREALLDQFRHLDSMSETRKAFEDVGTSAPVRLTREQKGALIDVIEFWGSQVEGGLSDGLPEGVFHLRNALHDDLSDTSS
jgi:hypothetical protein